MGCALALSAWMISLAPAAPAPVTTGTLLREMVDMEGLARCPDPDFRTVQFSSYDRRSQRVDAPGWFANSDGFGREPIPGFVSVLRAPGDDGVGEYLMAQVDGPGAIVRGWTAGIDGEIVMTLDGAAEPVYSGPAGEFLADRFGHYARALGMDPDAPGNPFRQVDADYFPIPFGKSLRVVWKGRLARLHFYHLQVRRYPAGTDVRTFAPDDLKTFGGDLDRSRGMLLDPAKLDSPPGAMVSSGDADVPAGGTAEAFRIEGGGRAIRVLRIRVAPGASGDIEAALRGVILEICFDGSPRPQVECPIGDFFGAGPGINAYRSLPMTVGADGTMTCRFAMPFATSALARLRNRTDENVAVHWEIASVEAAWDPARSLHFRARWRVDHDLDAAPAACDLPFIVAKGKGVYVGTTSIIMNPSPVPTAAGNWWGEGDEKVFVDDEAFPSTFGTGSEDYYNYSWSRCDLFAHPYCAQPLDTGPDTRGYVTNIRWHILDDLPFATGIAFYMELYSHNPTPGLSYARIAYHYGEVGLRDDSLPIAPSDARVPPLPEGWKPVALGAARNATFFQAEDLPRRGENNEIAGGRLWSAGKLLLWKPKAAGERIAVTLPVPKAGKQAIAVTAALGPAGGTFRLLCDGERIPGGGEDGKIDLRFAGRPMLRNFFWGPVDLTAGDHAVEIEAIGAAGAEIGLDFFWLRPR
ncbi:MAG: DUF2961 domain-containing protein [Planctomycetes bacterium]|nr:DUF2961 domain-containing protein [Planctomycetota bacterium]